ncbi:BON domain-containing protein [bacterium]|nr:BON domain-containing protein [bacterium]
MSGTTGRFTMTSRTGMIHFSTALLMILLLALGFSLPPTARAQMDDGDITLAVTNALLNDEGVTGYTIDVETENGIVTLEGTANNLLAKRRTERIVTTVKGVKAVINRIEIAETDLTDFTIRENVRDALIYDPATDSWEIEADVKDHVVTLTGDVESWQEAQLAEKVVAGIAGVKDVVNNIAVDYVENRPDREIRQEIEEALAWDKRIDAALVEVNVNNSKVNLDGIVGSLAEKREATKTAWVMGVEKVDNSDLKVESWAREDRFRKDKYVDKGEEEVEAAVRMALKHHPRVNHENITVDMDDGIATLSGTVDNVGSKRAAVETARNTVGVWSVKDFIAVRPSTPDDTQIRERIENAMEADATVESYEIDVEVNEGDVKLSGLVDTYYEKMEAEEVAANTYGVVEINNNIKVEDSWAPYTWDPYVDDRYVYDYNWYEIPTDIGYSKDDWELRREVEDELWWSPFVDRDEITIHVDNGIVTLTGTVESLGERMKATENALEAGARAVDNDLNVIYGPEHLLD